MGLGRCVATHRICTIMQKNALWYLSTGVILAYLPIFDIILAAVFWMHCSL